MILKIYKVFINTFFRDDNAKYFKDFKCALSYWKYLVNKELKETKNSRPEKDDDCYFVYDKDSYGTHNREHGDKVKNGAIIKHKNNLNEKYARVAYIPYWGIPSYEYRECDIEYTDVMIEEIEVV